MSRVDSHWVRAGKSYQDLKETLEDIPAGLGGGSTTDPVVTFGYPSNAFAFRRAVSDLIRDGLEAIRASGRGFIAEFAHNARREGV